MTIPNSVISIGRGAFADCGLTSLTIPNSVNSIGSYALGGTPWLNMQPDGLVYAGNVVYTYKGEMAENTEIVLKEGTLGIAGRAFDGCSGLISIFIPSSVTSIGSGAFMDCTSLKYIEIPEGVSELDGTFGGCTSLETVVLPQNSLKKISGAIGAVKVLTIPNSVTEIGDIGSPCLTYLDLGDGVKEMRQKDLKGCTSLRFLRIGKSLENVDMDQYSDAVLPVLEEIVSDSKDILWWFWADSSTPLKRISYGGNAEKAAIAQYKSLESIKIGKKVNEINLSGSDLQLPNLSTIEVDNENPFFDSRDNCNAIIESASNTLIVGANYTKIPNSVAVIGAYAFSHKKLRTIDIPESVTRIEECAFHETAIETIKLPQTISYIGGGAFWECHNLTSIDIPNNVTYIGPQVFSECENLITAKLGNGIKSIYQDLFSGCTKLKYLSIGSGLEEFAADGASVFRGCNVLEEVFVDCNVSIPLPESIKRITFGDNVKEINCKSWHGGDGLIELHIGKKCSNINMEVYGFTSPNLETIVISPENSVFYSTERNDVIIDKVSKTIILGSINTLIPNDIVTIGEHAFAYRNIETIVLPHSVKNIGHGAFANCTSIKDMYCLCNKMVTSDGDAFIGASINNATLHIPSDLLEEYKDDYEWGYFGNIVTLKEGDPGYEEPKDDVTLAAKSYSRVYGDPNPTFEYTVTGGTITSGTPTITCSATVTSPVGTYDIVIAKGTVSNSNVELVKGTLTITKAPLTISAGNYTKVEGEDNPTFTPTYFGFKNGETEAVLTKKPIVTCEATKESNSGSYKIEVNGAEAQNYDISYVQGWLTIEENPNKFEEDGTSYEILDDETVAITKDWKVQHTQVLPLFVYHNGNSYTVTVIGADAFKNNQYLTQVTIPSTIVKIGAGAFAGCVNLTVIIIHVENPIDIANARTRIGGSSVFEGVDKETCILYVPDGSVEAYKTADGWNEFKYILPISALGINGAYKDGKPFDIYTLQGRKIRHEATSLDGLPKGVYIINGRKVVK